MASFAIDRLFYESPAWPDQLAPPNRAFALRLRPVSFCGGSMHPPHAIGTRDDRGESILMETRHICRRAPSSVAMIVTLTFWIACGESQEGVKDATRSALGNRFDLRRYHGRRWVML